MNRQALLTTLLGLVIIGAVAGSFIYFAHRQRLHLTGQVVKVRTHSIEPGATLAVIDFRITNPSEHQFVVKRVDVFMTDANSKEIDSMTISETDARRLFEYYPILGQKYNPSLVIRDKIEAGQTYDRMIAVRFPVDERTVQGRKDLRINIEDIDEVKAQIQ